MLDKENRFPTEAVKKMGELGLMGLPYELSSSQGRLRK